MTDKLLSPLERAKVYEENIGLFFPQLETSIFEARPEKVILTVEYGKFHFHIAGFNFSMKQLESENKSDLIHHLVKIEQKLSQNGR